MNGVKIFQILLVVVRQLSIDFFHPPIGEHVFTGGSGAEVDHGVVSFNHRVKDPDQVEERLVRGHGLRLKPFTYKDDDWPALSVNPSLVETTRLLYFCEVLLFSPFNKFCEVRTL